MNKVISMKCKERKNDVVRRGLGREKSGAMRENLLGMVKGFVSLVEQ